MPLDGGDWLGLLAAGVASFPRVALGYAPWLSGFLGLAS